MARLIDADEALRMIKDCRTDNPYLNTNAFGEAVWKVAHGCAISCVEACPTVDAVEVVHGRWIPSKLMVLSDKCSVCHGWSTRHSVNERKFRYCPNCGAKMDGERKDND